MGGGGVGKDPFITDGFHRSRKVISKLELGTWAERLSEMVEETKDCHSFETVKAKVAQITRWWDLTAEYLEKNSTKLGDAVQKILKATNAENPFPEGMDMNWALDVQSAQTLDFFAGIQGGNKAWDLGTLTGVSAAVLSQHMTGTTVEREASLVNFARKHLPENVEVVQSEIEAFLEMKAAQGEKSDFIFMDLDKPMYARCYKLIMEKELLAPGGIMLCDNVLYRGLTAQHNAGELPAVSEKTAANAAAMDAFLGQVREDTAAGKVRSLMMPVREGCRLSRCRKPRRRSFSISDMSDELFSDFFKFSDFLNFFRRIFNSPSSCTGHLKPQSRRSAKTVVFFAPSRASLSQGFDLKRVSARVFLRKRSKRSEQSQHARALADVQARRSHCAGRQAVLKHDCG